MSASLRVRATATGIRFGVRTIPRAKSTRLAGIRDDALLCRVVAAPVDGSANRAVTQLLARTLGVSKSAVRIVRGSHTPHKTVEVDGITAQLARHLLRDGPALSDRS